MEEEIITSEETYDYDKLRYTLDNDGYIFHVSFGGYIVCDLGKCTEYTGEVPSGYSTIEEWHDEEIDKLNAWKIVNGNLVFDENKYNELQKKCEKEAEENSFATHKWVRNQLGKSNQVVIDEFSNSASGTSLIVLNDSGEYEIPNLTVSGENVESCEVLVSNKNLLGNDAVTQVINGITFTINEDKTIKINGTATANIELNLKGTSNNLDMLFLIQKETNYVVGGLVNGINLNLYNFDGNDRTLIGTYGNKEFTLNENYKVTQTSLVIASGAKFANITISPQLEIGEETDYIEHQENRTTATLTNDATTINELYSYYPTSIIMTSKEVNIEVDYFRYKTLEEEFTKIETTSNEIVISVSSVNDRLDILGTNIDEETGEVTCVKTGKGYTFGDDGLNISDPNESFNTQITNKTIQHKNDDEVITETSIDGFMTTDFKEKGKHQYSYDKDSDVYDFVAERIEVENEYAYAHFYNGGDL